VELFRPIRIAWLLAALLAIGSSSGLSAEVGWAKIDGDDQFVEAEPRLEAWEEADVRQVFAEEDAAPFEPGEIVPDARLAYETWQLMPDGVMYPSYLAGEKEPRFQAVWLRGADGIWRWETALGGRVALFRHGTLDPVRPEGFEVQLEGAALARVQVFEPSAPLDATDYRIGFLGVWREGPVAFKAGYYHLSSHAGDELLLANPGYVRVNYVRDSFIAGTFIDLTENLQAYGEFGYAGVDGGAKPIEFQYGLQMSPQGPTGFKGKPFAAINGHTRQDFNWVTSVNVVAGWQWRGDRTNHLWRVGMQFYRGAAMQWEFAGRNETWGGGGIWYDF
jgi:hypothetical protein